MDAQHKLGAFFIVIDPLRFAGGALLAVVVAQMAERMQHEPGSVEMPGDPELRTAKVRLAQGIPIEKGLALQMQALSERVGVPPIAGLAIQQRACGHNLHGVQVAQRPPAFSSNPGLPMALQLHHGIRPNLSQFFHQLLQVLLVGLTLGMTRTVVPALAESDFGVPKNSFVLLSAFVVAFGLVKGTMNFVAGRLSERIGRKRVLMLGWLVALPIPVMVWYAPGWNWVVAAMVLLGVNQGLTWSMTQTSKLDITRLEERGLTLGLNEFAGYVGVALAGIATAYLAAQLGARQGILLFGLSVIVLALALTQLWVKDTLPWAQAEAARHAPGAAQLLRPRYPVGVSVNPSTREIFALMSWRDKRLVALCQAGLVEKFVDALVWIFYPVFLYQSGASLTQVGWIIGLYGLVWGASQLWTGRLSDRIGRHRLNVWGMWICGAGVAAMVLGDGVAWWAVSSAVSGLGMALLYPNLSAAVADIAHPAWRGSAIGIYRFWRDLGYGVGALGLGLAAHFSGQMQAAFWFVAVSMLLSGALLAWWGEETHPRLNPSQ